MTISFGNASRLTRGCAVALLMLGTSVFITYAAERDPRDAALPGQVPEIIQKVIAFDKAEQSRTNPTGLPTSRKVAATVMGKRATKAMKTQQRNMASR